MADTTLEVVITADPETRILAAQQQPRPRSYTSSGQMLSRPPSSRSRKPHRPHSAYGSPLQDISAPPVDSRHQLQADESSAYRTRSHTFPSRQSHSNDSVVIEHQADDEIASSSSQPTENKLSDFVALNSRLFPQRIQICKGFYSSSGEVSLSQGEIFDFHFVKHTKVMAVKDEKGVEYSVPLNSSLKFGLLYDPYGNEKMAMKATFNFRTAGEIMTLKKMPTLICANKTHEGATADSSVHTGEVLIIEGIKHTIRGRLLKVHSLEHGKKYIHEKCVGKFSTSSADIQMSLSAMFEHSIPFPQKAVIYVEGDIARLLPAHLLKSPVTLKQCKIEKSVVATSLMIDGLQGAIDMPVDLDIEVKAVELPADTELSQLQSKTRYLYKNFHPKSLFPYIDMPTSVSYRVQCELYTRTREDLKLYGIHVVRPDFLVEAIGPAPTTIPEPLSATFRDFSENSEEISPTSTVSNLQLQSHVDVLEVQYKHLSDTVTDLSQRVTALSSKVDQLTKIVENSMQFNHQIDNLAVTDNLMGWCSKMQEEIAHLQNQLSMEGQDH